MKKKSEKSIKYYDPKDSKVLVFEVFPRSKKVIYYLRDGKSKDFSEITFDGYSDLPTGLYLNKRGYGFGKKGFFLLEGIKEHIGGSKKVGLCISNRKAKSIKGTKNLVVTLPHDAVRDFLVRLGRLNEDHNGELRRAVASFLSTKFPKKINAGSKDFDQYQGGEIASILRRSKVAEKLNEEDLQGLKIFFPKIFDTTIKKSKKGIRDERSALIQETKNVTDRIFLDEVIEEFETKLKNKTPEEKWQKFLKDKVFLFLASYVTSVEKQNVSLDVSYPDFVLVDVYGFIDVFEIKRGDTQLLAFDTSHENYYWKPEVAQAISQIENYIDAVIHNADDYIKSVRRKKRVDIKVIRPRGYIIAGNSKQFKTEKELEDFRKLGSSLRNINFVLYDELLERLKNLRSKL